MIPQLQRSTAPGVARQQYAGLGARANAGIGQALAGLGSQVSALAQEQADRGDALADLRRRHAYETWWYEELRGLGNRRKELAATTLDPETGGNITGYDREMKDFPSRMKTKFDEMADGLSPKARQGFEAWYNQRSPAWADHLVRTAEQMDVEDATAEMLELAANDRLADAGDIFEVYEARLTPASRQQILERLAAASARAVERSTQDYLQQVAATDPDGWEASARLIGDPGFQQAFGLDLDQAAGITQRLNTFVNAGRLKAQAELEAEREKTRDALNDKLAGGALTYADIDDSPLEEAEQQRYVGWMQADLDRRLAGPQIVTDEAVRHSIKAQALDIARGRVSYSQVIAAANDAKAAGKLDDDAYRDVLAAARGELSGIQAEALQTASRSAQRQLVTVSESAIERYAELMAGGSPGAKNLLARAENQRQFEYRLLDLHDAKIREFTQNNPEAAGDEIHRQSRRLLQGLRRADADERSRLLGAWDMELSAPILRPGPSGNIEVYDRQTRQRVLDGKPVGPPDGLEAIWETLTGEEQATVTQLLRRGFTPEDLIEHYRRQPATP